MPTPNKHTNTKFMVKLFRDAAREFPLIKPFSFMDLFQPEEIKNPDKKWFQFWKPEMIRNPNFKPFEKIEINIIRNQNENKI